MSSGSRPGGIRPPIAIDQLPGRGDADRVDVEGEVLRVFYHVEQVGVRAAELLFAVHAEGVIPHDPTTADEPVLLLQHDFQLGRVFVADGQPEGAVRLEHADHFGGPLAAPVQVFFAFQAIVVRIVLVADVEGRVGKSQIDQSVVDLPHSRHAIAVVEHVELAWHAESPGSLLGKTGTKHRTTLRESRKGLRR